MNRIKEVLDEKGVSQSTLAKRMGVTRQHVNNLCQNKEQPSLSTLHEIAQILEVRAAELVGDNSELN